MSTVSEIVTQAFREGNFIAVGETPTAEELIEAVPRLRNLVDSLLGLEIGEAYSDWHVPSDVTVAAPLRSALSNGSTVVGATGVSWQYPPSNVRMLVNTTEARSIYLPSNPSDGARLHLLNMGSSGALIVTLNGNGRLIENAVSLAGTLTTLHGRKWFYRADLGDWVRYIGVVDTNSAMPFPAEFDDLFVCGLAMRLSARFQTAVDDVTVSRYTDILRRFKKRYRQSEAMPASFNELRQTSHEVTGI